MYEQIHETVLRDAIDIIIDAKRSDEVQGILNKDKSFKSISSASSNLVLVFPGIMSRNNNMSSASMVAKAIERKCVTMLQMLLSAASISDATDGIDFIKRFHTNLKSDSDATVDNFIDAMDQYVIKSESFMSSDNRVIYEQIKADLKCISHVLPDSINEHSLNEYRVSQDYYGEPIVTIRESSDDSITDYKNTLSAISTSQDMLKNQIMDSDVKKANELIPTLMVVNYINTTTGESIPTQMVIGVKVKMYVLDSADIVSRIISKNEDNNGFLKLIRATTREISFFRDFLFAINKAKVDALSSSKKGSSSKLWKVLERRSLKSKIRRTLGHTNDASAISTLVISQDEVEYIKKNENINVEDPQVIRPIMEAYNLMGFCIIDDSLEVAKFIFDTGDDVYETVSFSMLEKETNDGGYKKIINLMTKMSR